ncbi:MAG TPA: hypothetical protein VJA26_12405 [Gammaproteobacteria bacterium]|nr:hypothetical protein [Gammaproteobacteria bacterium]
MSADHPPISLTYFDARGRAQYLRYYLHYRDVRYDDDRVPLSADFSAWLAIRGDRAIVGPFHKLPALHWDGRTIVETLVIHAFLHKTLGDQARLSEDENLRHAMLTSSLHVDVMLPIGTLIWAEVAYAGVDLSALTKRTVERLRSHLASLNRTLDEWRWLEDAKERPVMLADCLHWEEQRRAACVRRSSASQRNADARAFLPGMSGASAVREPTSRPPVSDHRAPRGRRRHRQNPRAARLKNAQIGVRLRFSDAAIRVLPR